MYTNKFQLLGNRIYDKHPCTCEAHAS